MIYSALENKLEALPQVAIANNHEFYTEVVSFLTASIF